MRTVAQSITTRLHWVRIGSPKDVRVLCSLLVLAIRPEWAGREAGLQVFA